MKKNIFLSMLVLLALSVSFVSCSKDDGPVIVKNGTVTLEMPINVTDVVLNNFTGTATNVQSGKVTTLANPTKVGDNYVITIPELEEGTYNIAAKGNISFQKGEIAGNTDFEVASNSVSVTEKSSTLKLAVNSFQADGGFVISEIFFTGTTTPEDNPYLDDQYMVITNNSDVTLYADGIAVLESEFMTTDQQDYTPDLMSEAFSAQAIYQIPGNGTSVPVEPGKSLLLAINGVNHKEANANSFDLSGADFEFYDESSNPNITDPDGKPANLDKWYCYTATVYNFHNRGSIALPLPRWTPTRRPSSRTMPTLPSTPSPLASTPSPCRKTPTRSPTAGYSMPSTCLLSLCSSGLSQPPHSMPAGPTVAR